MEDLNNFKQRLLRLCRDNTVKYLYTRLYNEGNHVKLFGGYLRLRVGEQYYWITMDLNKKIRFNGHVVFFTCILQDKLEAAGAKVPVIYPLRSVFLKEIRTVRFIAAAFLHQQLDAAGVHGALFTACLPDSRRNTELSWSVDTDLNVVITGASFISQTIQDYNRVSERLKSYVSKIERGR